MAKGIKGFGVSPLTNRIYYGTQNVEKQMFTGNKEDVTDKAIAAVTNQSDGCKFWKRLSYPKDLGYFNSGVCLIRSTRS